MAEETRNEDTEQTELDEDIAMALVNHVINTPDDPEGETDPRTKYPSQEFEPQTQDYPGWTEAMNPRPDHGEQSYVGHHRMMGMRALITGGDSGIGRAVAIAYAREGADVAFTYLPEEEQDAEQTVQLIEDAGSRALALPGDLQDEEFCQEVIAQTVAEFDGLNVLVNNAGFQMTTAQGMEDLSSEQFDRTFKTNVYALFWLTKAALPHLKPGAAIINTSSIQGYHPSPSLMDYAATKAAINSMTFSLAESLGPKGIRVNAVAPGPVWTPLQPPTQPAEKIEKFGQDTPLGRAGQPAELAATYVLLATEESSYISGSVIGVTGGKHLA
ncbi:NAD(P)-dependent dehydrogenase (short-subunit alcohol dehydrogenase family) [Pseudarthrobacter sp. PvP004]|jgi:NAD(P)-dependent dehydrogenase (short-subunit alcohol dehydrogenase family)|nr:MULTISPECIES: SDR family oxidoreductase [Micrococcaceae]MBP2267115.1 NAD(P)-dependent dehydrogenase (short-subunit alcohol dehydrogenase family) [Pseudarthrobacter sp. PvP004]